MNRPAPAIALAAAFLFACASPSTTPGEPPAPEQPEPTADRGGQTGPAGRPAGAAARPGGSNQTGPRPYDQVITAAAVSEDGLFKTHRIGNDLYFEIPSDKLGVEMLLLGRPVANSAQSAGGFFGGGTRLIVEWNRSGNRIHVREKKYDVVASEDAAISRQVDNLRQGPIIGAFDIAAFGPDSSAVIDVTALYTAPNDLMGSIEGLQRDRSWIEEVHAFPGNVEVEATQTGNVRSSGPGGPGGPPGPGAGGNQGPRPQTQRVHWSMMELPAERMMPRLHDKRVGFNNFSFHDMGRPEHRSEEITYIRRFRLEKANPAAAMSDPVEPIVYWIDPATPDWLKPWVKSGVDAWQVAFEEAGFTNAIEGRFAPTKEEDPTWSLYDARYSVIYWRPSTVPNATGGQVWDPRSGEILKGEVNMYHNVMNLVRNWYFTQVSPVDPRAQSLPMPDSLMGALVEYVVTHEVGHSIGFPHNMKASAMYPADSLRSATFLERMGGHVATLMDYSRFNYVVQPEDGVPPHLLIPGIGPYDRFAVRWGYSVVPGATSPEGERSTLDSWARMQDTIPWFRFSTSDSRNDPENLTEAVGDQDAVKSTKLGMRNLERVATSLIRVAEREGEDYALLEELYSNAVQQWGRYMGHVAALVGGALTQERYGTGARFAPVSRARQQEAVRYLNEVAFITPAIFVDAAILTRIEAEGVVPRIRTAQSRVLRTLINAPRMSRMVEYEALAAAQGNGAYTIADLMGDLRQGVWGEVVRGTARIDVHRRNLQRAYLEAVDAELNPPERPSGPQFGGGGPQVPVYNSDARPVLRGELRELDRLVQSAIGRAGDRITRLHLEDVRMEIERILEGPRRRG